MKITNVGNLAHLLSSFSSPGFGKMKIDKYFFFNMKVSKVGILQGCIKLGVTVPLLLLFLRAISKIINISSWVFAFQVRRGLGNLTVFGINIADKGEIMLHPKREPHFPVRFYLCCKTWVQNPFCCKTVPCKKTKIASIEQQSPERNMF